MSRRLSTVLGEWLEAAFEKHANGERFMWEMTVSGKQMVPGQQPLPVLMVVVWMPSATLGEVQNGSFLLTNPIGVDEDTIDGIVHEFLDQMLQARSQSLAQQVNGTPVPRPGTPGLIA